MTLDGFVGPRRQSWEELEGLLEVAGGRPSRLDPEQILRLGTLYRGAAADLAVARRRFPRDGVRRRLEGLVRRGAITVYEPRPPSSSIGHFATTGYWRLIAERPAVLAASAVLLLAPVLLAALWAHSDPGNALSFIPSQFRGAADPPLRSGYSGPQEAIFSAQLFTNNIQVTFMAFAFGILAAAGTGLVLAYNGLLLGAVAGVAVQAGNGDAFLRFVIPHGPLELSCIIVSGAAGLRLGLALVDPGPLPRRTSLQREGRRCVGIIIGTMPWLVVAGIMEAFVRGSGLPLAALMTIGIGLFGLFWGLVFWRGGLAGRRDREPSSRLRATRLARPEPGLSSAGTR